jgi:hypothetical protein
VRVGCQGLRSGRRAEQLTHTNCKFSTVYLPAWSRRMTRVQRLSIGRLQASQRPSSAVQTARMISGAAGGAQEHVVPDLLIAMEEVRRVAASL